MTELAQRQPSKISKAVANERPSWTDSATNPSPPTDKGLGGQGLANTGDTSSGCFSRFPLHITSLPNSLTTPRENHGLHNPCGSQVRVAAGTGTGWKFPTRKKPVPAGGLCGFVRVFFLRHRVSPSSAAAH